MLRNKKRNIILFLYVDNIFIVVKFKKQMQWFKNEFQKIFKIKNLRKIKKIFDIKIIRDRKRRTIRMNQFYYLNEIFDELHMIADKHIQTTFFMNEYNFLRSIELNDKRINLKNYQHKIDKFMYVAIHIRSNIIFAIKYFNQYFNNLIIHHEQALMILL